MIDKSDGCAEFVELGKTLCASELRASLRQLTQNFIQKQVRPEVCWTNESMLALLESQRAEMHLHLWKVLLSCLTVPQVRAAAWSGLKTCPPAKGHLCMELRYWVLTWMCRCVTCSLCLRNKLQCVTLWQWQHTLEVEQVASWSFCSDCMCCLCVCACLSLGACYTEWHACITVVHQYKITQEACIVMQM